MTQFRNVGTPYDFGTNIAIQLNYHPNGVIVEWALVDLFSHDTCKTANVNLRHINNNKTANIKEKT